MRRTATTPGKVKVETGVPCVWNADEYVGSTDTGDTQYGIFVKENDKNNESSAVAEMAEQAAQLE